MSTREEHLPDSLGAYVLGALDEIETRAVAAHLAACAECREQADELTEMKDALGEVPPEAFLEGPPEDGDLVLQRTLRQVRAEKASGTRTRNLAVTAAAVIAVAIALGGGVVLGRNKGSATVAALPPPATTAPSIPAGTRYITGTEGGSRLNVRIEPAAGWVRLNASVTGIPAGQKCVLMVRSKSGDTQTAGSWVVSAKAAKNGTNLDGSALVPMDQVASVYVMNTDGHVFVSASA
jgi:anti-sigma factor RsiW